MKYPERKKTLSLINALNFCIRKYDIYRESEIIDVEELLQDIDKENWSSAKIKLSFGRNMDMTTIETYISEEESEKDYDKRVDEYISVLEEDKQKLLKQISDIDQFISSRN